jgi:NAD-dependent deacetylase
MNILHKTINYWKANWLFFGYLRIMKKRIVVLSGAGISAESGISTFRDSNGLWENHAIEEVATPEAWKRNPELVQRFYNERRKQVLEVGPNDAHRYFAQLEEDFDVAIVTQNIDDLHERGGSTNVLHLHGNIRQSKSSGPNQEHAYYPIEGWELKMNDTCPEGYVLRPHVVWFGEAVPNLELAAELISETDFLVVVGTSLNVYPAAGLIHYAPANCKKFLIDPKAAELVVDSTFLKIGRSAVDGVQELDGHLEG